jgi:uncharacterized membrane protein HdeD (DUF308 family)
MPLMAVPKFERFFRAASEVDVDKDDLKRYIDFVHQKLTTSIQTDQSVEPALGASLPAVQPAAVGGIMSLTDRPATSLLRQAARMWWLDLIFGVAWILFGMALWSYRVGSIVALAVLIGITMIFNGATEIVIGSRLPVLRTLLVTVGVLSVLAGVWALAWPGPTLYVIALFLGWFLFVMGIVHVVLAFTRMREDDYWWVLLIQGFIEFVLGAWARGDSVRSFTLFINLAGAFAVIRGVSEIFAAFQLRRLKEELGEPGHDGSGSARPTSAPPAQPVR